MKIIQLLMSAALVTGTLGFGVRPLAAEPSASATILGRSGDYCHMKFPAMHEATLRGKQPMLKDDDIIDFYGPCDHDPTGRDEIQEQEIQMQRRRHGILGD
ncbi:MAG TPA: hypothetical protein VHV54_19510 [Candidatus Binatia bacterium]|nr:hypothetical protein [Candidatus Binatia bacterium]